MKQVDGKTAPNIDTSETHQQKTTQKYLKNVVEKSEKTYFDTSLSSNHNDSYDRLEEILTVTYNETFPLKKSR